MGAEWFCHVAEGDSSKEAFLNAVEEAKYWNGHGGYTGTIAEKTSFGEIAVPEGLEPNDFVRLLEDPDEQKKRGLGWLDDKWGPAGCIKVKEGQWAFFCWASS